jgi:hypothetical protein
MMPRRLGVSGEFLFACGGSHGVNQGEVDVGGLQRAAQRFFRSETQGLEIFFPFSGADHDDEGRGVHGGLHFGEKLAVGAVGEAFFAKYYGKGARAQSGAGFLQAGRGIAFEGQTLEDAQERFPVFRAAGNDQGELVARKKRKAGPSRCSG